MRAVRANYGSVCSRNILPERFGQGHEVSRIATPAADRGSVEKLAKVHQARSAHRSPCVLKVAACVFRLQTAVLEDGARYAFNSLDQLLVLHIRHDALRQHVRPMVHDSLVATVVAPELGKVIGKGLACREQQARRRTYMCRADRGECGRGACAGAR
jgi:hypothetical protein